MKHGEYPLDGEVCLDILPHRRKIENPSPFFNRPDASVVDLLGGIQDVLRAERLPVQDAVQRVRWLRRDSWRSGRVPIALDSPQIGSAKTRLSLNDRGRDLGPFVHDARDLARRWKKPPQPTAPSKHTVMVNLVGIGAVSCADFAQASGGVMVGMVTPGGAAVAAGLQTGDIISAIDDEALDMLIDYTTALRTQAPGDVLTLTVRRGTETLTLTATVQQRK